MPAMRTTRPCATTPCWTPRPGSGRPAPSREEIARRFDRLDVEDLPGTLLYLGFSRAPAELHSAVAMRLAEELRDIVRPTDLLGRIDATTIGLWCDGMDHLTGGERAAKFCTQLPAILPERTPITVGVAPRWAGSGDDTATVIEHAAVALRLAEIADRTRTPARRPAALGASGSAISATSYRLGGDHAA